MSASTGAGSTLERLAEVLRRLDPLLAEAVIPWGAERDATGLGATAATGPRAAADPETYALVVEAVREGYLQHYAGGRVVRTQDVDLALLAGDRLYALGLARLAELGALEAVGELADVIGLAAQAQAEEDPGRAEAVWAAGARAVGAGPSPEHEAAKAAWRRTPARAG